MLIQDLESAGTLPVLGKMLQFAAARQKVLANNIANIETPDYRPMDLSVKSFQQSLAKAVKRRDAATGGEQGELHVEDTKEVVNGPGGTMQVKPHTASGNILYHDRNNRDVERMMQDLAENSLAYRTAVDLMKRQNDLLRTAISQRV